MYDLLPCTYEDETDHQCSLNRNSSTSFLWTLTLSMICLCRKNELHQVAQQASNIEDLTEVVRTSISVMCKQWSDAMHTFREKFNSLSSLIVDHGN